jgi:hypothetical protein
LRVEATYLCYSIPRLHLIPAIIPTHKPVLSCLLIFPNVQEFPHSQPEAIGTSSILLVSILGRLASSLCMHALQTNPGLDWTRLNEATIDEQNFNFSTMGDQLTLILGTMAQVRPPRSIRFAFLARHPAARNEQCHNHQKYRLLLVLYHRGRFYFILAIKIYRNVVVTLSIKNLFLLPVHS